MKLLPQIICLTVIAALTLGSGALAGETVKFPEKGAGLALTLPDKWEAEIEDDGLTIVPPDDESLVIEVMALEAGADNVEGAVKEAKDMLKDFKNLQFEDPQKGEINGLGLIMLNATGEDADGKVKISMAIFHNPKAETLFLLSGVSSPEASDKHGDAIVALVQSVKAK